MSPFWSATYKFWVYIEDKHWIILPNFIKAFECKTEKKKEL